MSAALVRTRGGDLLGLLAIVALCLGISAIGGWITTESVGTWYENDGKSDGKNATRGTKF